MLAALNGIGRVINIRTIAEQVESGEVLDHIEAPGIDYALGYFISRPCPIEEIHISWPATRLQRAPRAQRTHSTAR